VPDATGATTSAALAPKRRNITAFPAHGITAEQAWGATLVAVGLALFVFRKRIAALGPRLGTAGVFGLSGAVVVGAMLIIAGGGQTAAQPSQVQNPVAADQRSVDAGKATYAANCAKCHGDTGHGDGPLAAALNPKPLDLTVHVGLHPDGQLFDWITNGVPRSQMPAWKGSLTPSQRWDVINYLRSLSPTALDTQTVPGPPAASR
jgi:mono/diheme cytochrome c family protein